MSTPHPPHLVVTCGPPASGKSTWARTQPGVVVACDREAVGGAAMSRVITTVGKRLAIGGRVIVDAPMLRLLSRMDMLHAGHAYCAYCELLIFGTPIDVCRGRDGKRVHGVGAYYDWQRASELRELAVRTAGSEGWDSVRVI